MFGITPDGFFRKSKDQILSEIYSLAQIEFGSDADIGDYSPLGKFCKLLTEVVNELWELFEEYFYQSYIDTADGVNLDRLGALGGLTRKQAQKETVELTFEGTDYTNIPAGFLIQTLSGIVFETLELGVIQAGTVTVNALAVNTGLASRVSANQLTQIVTPIAGLDSVSNAEPSQGGSERESDADFRNRILSSIEVFSSNNSGSMVYITTVILNEDDVANCYIVENEKSVDYNGMPPHSMHILVEGGEEARIAELIFQLKPAGIELIGDILVNHSHNGVIHPIRFSRPDYTDIYIKVDVYPSGSWDSDTIDLIKRKIVSVIGGVDNTVIPPVEYTSTYSQSTLTAWALYPELKDLPGFIDLDITFSVDDITYYKVANIPSGTLARTNSNLIDVTVI